MSAEQVMAKNAVVKQLRESHPARAPISQTPALLFILTATTIFAAETGLMLVLAIFHERMTVWEQALIDGLVLTLVAFPPLYLFYLFTFRPMLLHNAELLRFGKQLEDQIAERRETEAALRQSEIQLHLLSAQLLTVQEMERQRVSRELHEDLGQSLIVLKLRLRQLEGVMKHEQSIAHQELRGASKQIDDMVRHIRRLSCDLRPAMLEDLGFTAAARRLVCDYARDSGPITTVTIDNDIDLFLKGAEGIHIYRILQEALENVQNHAEASHLAVTVKASERELSLMVEDDGKGFNPKREERGGLGLTTMYERARMLNSCLDLWSEPGKGTRITLRISKQRNSCMPCDP
jgi:signal transduction histidine kinase